MKKLKKLEDIDLSKYDAHQLEAVCAVFAEMTGISKTDLNRNVAEFGSWMTEETDLDEAVAQARKYAKAVNEGRRSARSDIWDTPADAEVKTSVLDWLTRRKKRGVGKKH